MNYDSLLLHTGTEVDEETGALSLPIYNASTYHQKDISSRQRYDYSRSGNPTRCAVEKSLAVLEGGHQGFAFASGMSAISSALFAVLKAGDHVVVTRDIYGGAFRFFEKFISSFGVEYTFVDATKIEEIEKAIRPNTRAIYIETPSNPLLTITDISSAARIARERGLVSLIDNTFMSPYLQRPIERGIDISIHSATKFLGGHSDLLAGAVITRTEELSRKVGFVQNTLGGVLSPQDSWLLSRGIKTLGARMKIQSESAMKIALWLNDQPWVKAVYYPGLPDHPGHALHLSQAYGSGAVLSFVVDSLDRIHSLFKNVKMWAVAVSLGGVDSILSYPWLMSHGSMPPEVKRKLGIDEKLIRLSVGLESPDDLILDLNDNAIIRS
ncbi:MAG TPA: PLP-dependent aspartate aminotransferase family protein [Spirochaetota bacterium]